MAGAIEDTGGNKPVVRGGRTKPEELYNAGDEEDVKKRVDLVARERASRDRDNRELISRPAFQRFLQRMMEDARAFERTYDTSKKRLIHEGRAMLAMEIWAEFESTNPEAMARILLSRLRARQER